MRLVGANVSSPCELPTYLQVMPPLIFPVGKLIGLLKLLLVALARIAVEEVTDPAVRSHQHIRRAIAVAVAVEVRVLEERAQQTTGMKDVTIVATEEEAALAVIGRRGLGYERVDVGELLASRKYGRTDVK